MTNMITVTHLILQVNENGTWHGLQSFGDAERAEANLVAARAEDPEAEYRLDDRSYETPARTEI